MHPTIYFLSALLLSGLAMPVVLTTVNTVPLPLAIDTVDNSRNTGAMDTLTPEEIEIGKKYHKMVSGKGGRNVSKKYGRKHMSDIAKRGAATRWAGHVAKRPSISTKKEK